MTRDDIIRMAGHREVPPWVMKLVQDCLEAEREECVKALEEFADWALKDDMGRKATDMKAGVHQAVLLIRARYKNDNAPR
jgi:hypothetical protein